MYSQQVNGSAENFIKRALPYDEAVVEHLDALIEILVVDTQHIQLAGLEALMNGDEGIEQICNKYNMRHRHARIG